MNKNVLIAVLVFVGLLVAVLVMRAQPAKVGVKELKIDAIARDQVSKIELVLPPKKPPPPAPDAGALVDAPKVQRVVLERAGEGFVVFDADAKGSKFPADDQSIDTALDALEELKVGDLISNKQEKLAELEIDDDKGMRAKITTKNGEVLDLIFGRASKGGGSTLRRAGSNDVFVAKGRFGAAVRKDVSQWRKKAIVGTEVDDITSVVVRPASGLGFTATASQPAPAAAGDAGPNAAPAPTKPEWNITEPATLPAGFRLDAGQVGRVAQSFIGVRASDYAEGISDEAAGLSGAHTVIEATHKDGRKTVLHLGKEDDKKRVYARVDGDAQLYLVSQFAAKQAARGLDELRDMTLFDVKKEDIVKATFKGDTTFVLSRDGEAWKLTEPKKAPEGFDVEQADSAISTALRTRAARLAPADASATGVDKPSPLVELELKGGKKVSLRFGAGLPPSPNDPPPPPSAAGKPDAKPEPREFYVKGGVDDLTYVIASFTRKRFDHPIDLFKKPPSHGGGPGGMPGMGGGMDSLPPDMRKKLEEALKKQQP